MPETEIILEVNGNNRKAIRDFLIMEFLKEEPGTGNRELTAIYYYYVDRTTSGVDIYLKRPARLNKGMDFEVHAENIIFENESDNGRITKTSRPSHSSMYYDLKIKKQENPKEYERVQAIIDRIYNCETVQDLEMTNINFNTGHSLELVLKIVKWLFIEQDITYWNWSGRDMFYSGLNQI